uniref:Ig-like domain-containing protein n=1 Tax=Vombatus ursinus TaxID=29139 RepID=A0A4X2LYI7_VOMUR
MRHMDTFILITFHFLFSFTNSTMGNLETTQPISLDTDEGQEVNVSYTHTSILSYKYIYWYRQFPNQGPHYVIHGLDSYAFNNIASLFIPEERKCSTPTLPWVTLGDAAVYYCALSDTVLTGGSVPV